MYFPKDVQVQRRAVSKDAAFDFGKSIFPTFNLNVPLQKWRRA
jgi:hypothetical protein